jgi:hypothetical protein
MSLDMWKKSALTIAMAATLAACGSDDDNNDKSTSTPLEQLNIACESVTQASTGISGATLELAVVDRYVSGNDFDTASAEIVSYDACSDQLFVVNSKEKNRGCTGTVQHQQRSHQERHHRPGHGRNESGYRHWRSKQCLSQTRAGGRRY